MKERLQKLSITERPHAKGIERTRSVQPRA
jgi:hypothetical protein